MNPRTLPLGILALLPILAMAQGTAGDYDHAAKLYEKTKDKVFRTRVVPHWFDEGRRFWYRNDLPGKAHEWILVDTKAGKRESAFEFTTPRGPVRVVGAGIEFRPEDRTKKVK